MINVLIPMSGRGSRFAQVGYTFPKPLIDVNNKPMIQVVVENLNINGKYIFLVLKEHYEKYALKYLLPLITKDNPCEIIIVDEVTEGAACTALLARDLIDNDDELIIANSDQWIDWEPNHFLNYIRNKKADGGILTFLSSHPRWSFVNVNNNGLITEVAEKRPISNIATCLWYTTRILLENGKTEAIGRLVNTQSAQNVICYNEYKNCFESKKITGWVKKKPTDPWYEMSYKYSSNRPGGGGGLNRRIIITGDHQVLTNKGYVRVDSLTSEHLVATKFYEPNKKQKELLDGTLLGDGFYRKPNLHGEKGRLIIKQSIPQTEWFKTKINALYDFEHYSYVQNPCTFEYKNIKKNSSGSITASFVDIPFWRQERDRWYVGKHKIVPYDVQLTPLSLATWYMDDGSLLWDKASGSLQTQCFTEEEVDFLRNQLFEKFDIITRKQKRPVSDENRGYIICIGNGGNRKNRHNSARKFFELIHEFIIPSMQYKLPEMYRGKYKKENFELGSKQIYFTEVSVKKLDISKKENKKYLNVSYCIEVEDNHNFIAGDMVVKNCGIYHWSKGSFFVNSADQMINKNIRVNNEFYVAPTYNELIQQGFKIYNYPVAEMRGLGTPEDLQKFLLLYENK